VTEVLQRGEDVAGADPFGMRSVIRLWRGLVGAAVPRQIETNHGAPLCHEQRRYSVPGGRSTWVPVEQYHCGPVTATARQQPQTAGLDHRFLKPVEHDFTVARHKIYWPSDAIMRCRRGGARAMMRKTVRNAARATLLAEPACRALRNDCFTAAKP
jgi:hypothetical protein